MLLAPKPYGPSLRARPPQAPLAPPLALRRSARARPRPGPRPGPPPGEAPPAPAAAPRTDSAAPGPGALTRRGRGEASSAGRRGHPFRRPEEAPEGRPRPASGRGRAPGAGLRVLASLALRPRPDGPLTPPALGGARRGKDGLPSRRSAKPCANTAPGAARPPNPALVNAHKELRTRYEPSHFMEEETEALEVTNLTLYPPDRFQLSQLHKVPD